MICDPCKAGDHRNCQLGECQCQDRLTEKINQELAKCVNASGDETLAEMIFSNLLYGGSEIARMLNKPGRLGVRIGEQTNAPVAGQSSPSSRPARFEKGGAGVGGFQGHAEDQRQLGSRRQSRSEGIGRSARPRDRRIAGCLHQDEHSEEGGRCPTVGGCRFGTQSGSDPREGCVVMGRVLNVVQKSVRFLGFSCRLVNLCESEGYGAGDGARTRDVQLGKLAFYH